MGKMGMGLKFQLGMGMGWDGSGNEVIEMGGNLDKNLFQHISTAMHSMSTKFFLDSSSFFTARRHASAVLAVVVCLIVVCPSHAGIVSKQLNAGSSKQRHTIAQGL